MGIQYPAIAKFGCSLMGHPGSFLAYADDQKLYVVKLRKNPEEQDLLFNEGLGRELYRSLGLAVPAWTPIFLPAEFVENEPNCWSHGASGTIRPSSGLHFASCLSLPATDMLAGCEYPQVQNRKHFWLAWLVDICAQHSGHRQVRFHEKNRREVWEALFIGHEHMFGEAPGMVDGDYAGRCRYWDARIYPEPTPALCWDICQAIQKLAVQTVWQTARRLPEEWLSATAMEGVASCLNRLQDSRYVSCAVDAMLEAHRSWKEKIRIREELSERPCISA